MFNPKEQIQFAEERRRELLRQARMHQLYRSAERDRARMGERLMAVLGDLMISSGTKLKARSASAVRYTMNTVETQNT